MSKSLQHVQGNGYNNMVCAEDLIGNAINVNDEARSVDNPARSKGKGKRRMFFGLFGKREKLPVETPSPEELRKGMREAELFQNLSILNKVEAKRIEDINTLSDAEVAFLEFIRNMNKEQLTKVRADINKELNR